MTDKKLIKELDQIFSKYIRLRDSVNDIGFCITCGKPVIWKHADCGHYIKRQYMATRFDEQNCNLQCKRCNYCEQGADEKYKIAIDKKYGKGTSERLEMRKHNTTRLPDFYIKSEIERYKEKVKIIEKNLIPA